MNHVHIAISGIIGVGKTSLAVKLGDKMDLPVYFEPVIDNKYLDEFYADMKSNSFSFQIQLLNQRFVQQQQVVWSEKGGIQDRSIYEDTIFARTLVNMGLMREKDYKTYESLFRNMSKLMGKPDFIIHLDVDPEESMKRIKKRGRECEKTITLEYLQALNEEYNKFLEEISLTVKVVRINWNDYGDIENVVELIKKECEMRRITQL